MRKAADEQSHEPMFLMVEDDAVLRERQGRALKERGYKVRTAANYGEAMRRATVERPDFAVLDLRMPGPSGLELASDLLKLCPEVKILLLTGAAMPAHPAAKIAYLKKPADVDAILEALDLR